MKKLMAVAVCAAGLAGYAADDHLVDVGASETLAANTEYGRLVVNGDLTVGADVELTVASLCVATNITGTANLVLEAGAKLTVTGTAAADCLIGAAGGHANLELKSGSLMTVSYFNAAYGYPSSPAKNDPATKATVVVSNATLSVTGATKDSKGNDNIGNFCTSNAGSWPSGTARSVPVLEVRLDEGGVLETKGIQHGALREANIIFNGGKIQGLSIWKRPFLSSAWQNSSSPFNFIATNGCPIHIVFSDNHSALLSGGSAGSHVKFSGDGDVILEGSKGSQPTRNVVLTKDKGHCYWLHSGKIIIRDPLMQFANNDETDLQDETYYKPHDWVIDEEGKLDLNGISLTTKSFAVKGSDALVNTGADCTLTMDNGAADWSLVRKLSVPSNVRLVKRGSGTLSLPEGYAPNLEVAEGGVCLTGRAITGYPFYKFNVYGTGNTGTANARVRIAELVYLNGDEDVTQGWRALYYTCSGTSYYNSPDQALDGDRATFFYDQRAQSYSAVSNIHFELEYPLPRKVTGYKWTYHTGIDSYNSNPTSWEVFGSDDNVNWVSLDYVEYQEAGWTGWTKRTCTIPPADDYAMTLAAGTALKVVGADVSGKVTTASDTLALEKGAKVELTAGTKVAELTIDADDATDSTVVNFDFAETGVLNVIGSARRLPAALPLALPDAADAVLSGWTVIYNGEPAHYLPVVKNGRLTRQSTQGLLLLAR